MKSDWMAAMLATLALPLLVSCASAAQPAPQINPTGPQEPPQQAQPAPAGNGALTQKSSIDEILDAMDARGKDLKDFTATVKLTESDQAVGTDMSRSGKIWLQRGEGGNDRVRVVFDKKKTDKGERPDKIEYVLDGGWLLDRDYGNRLQVRRQVRRPDEKTNLLKLGEGPFPLPLGQSKEDVHRLFEVKKMDPVTSGDTPDPPNSVHLQLTPKSGTEFESKFASLDFWADVNTRMPVRSATLDKNGTTLKTADLSDIQLNQGLKDSDFTPPKIDEKEWTLREKAFDE